MTHRHIVLDIEAIPDPDVPYAGEGFAPAPHWQIVCLASLSFEDHRPIALHCHDEPERAIVERFAHVLVKHGPTIVTWNGRGYDLPVLMARSLRHEVPQRRYYGRYPDYRYRFKHEGHLDLADVLSDYGAGGRSRLDAWARLCGLPGKSGVDGSQVAELWAAGERQRVRDYCCADVVQTAFVWLRSEYLRGEVDVDEYEAAQGALEAFVIEDERVAWLIKPEVRT